MKLLVTLFSLIISSCSMIGGTNETGYRKIISGSKTIEDITKRRSLTDIFRAIGSPNGTYTINGFQYYSWFHSESFGLNAFVFGEYYTFYCALTVEVNGYNMVTMLQWRGNDCSPYLNTISHYLSSHKQSDNPELQEILQSLSSAENTKQR